jgi:pimeloyl-ACP methyl ester carboxylesterase
MMQLRPSRALDFMALNYYRAVDPFTRNSAAFAGAKIRQPSMFLAGTLDGLNLVAQPRPESMRRNLIDLRSFITLDGVGHWTQLEAPNVHDLTATALNLCHDVPHNVATLWAGESNVQALILYRKL